MIFEKLEHTSFIPGTIRNWDFGIMVREMYGLSGTSPFNCWSHKHCHEISFIKIYLCKVKNKVEVFVYLSDQCEQEILHIFLK